MSSPSAQPNPHGSFSPENAPQVVVRAEKYYLCSSCGTLVEIPDDVVGQLGWAQQQPLKQQPAEEAVPSEASPQAGTRPVPAHRLAHGSNAPTKEGAAAAKPAQCRPRPQHPPQPVRATWAGKEVDGLTVPSGQQLDQAFKWITFHLKTLDWQGTEIKRLKKLLKNERLKTESTIRVPGPSPLGPASGVTQQGTVEPSNPLPKEHAQEDLGVAPKLIGENESSAKERGPP